MTIIRNGGFETGDMSFWGQVGTPTITAQTGTVEHGTHACSVVSSQTATQGIITNDYTQVSEGEIVNLYCWVNTSIGLGCRFIVYEYDNDGNLIDTDYIGRKGAVTGWTEMYGQYRVVPGVEYIRIAVVAVFMDSAQTLYIDSVSASRLKGDEILEMVRELCNETNETGNGNSIADAQEMLGCTDYYAEIGVTSFTGTNPTMDVEVREYDQIGYLRVLGTFTQVTAATNQRVGIARPIGDRLHAIWTMGGVVTDADFVITVIGVR